MEKATHTPGPWTIRHGTNIFAARGDVNHEGVVCNTGSHNHSHIECGPENEANARLIAAAPLGYELASEILRACDRSTGREISDVTRQEIEPLRLLAEKFMAQVKVS